MNPDRKLKLFAFAAALAVAVGLRLIACHWAHDVPSRVPLSRAILTPGRPESHEEGDIGLIVHILPHSHCDAAYKKTVDEYFETEVRHVLDSVVQALTEDKNRRFVWSETIFLHRWWTDTRTSLDTKNRFKELLKEQRLEIVNGGWVMHDEAITRYDSQIHQQTIGHDKIAQLLVDERKIPLASIETSWQIDPFGASATNVWLQNHSGMNFLVHNRFPPWVKDELKANRSLEFYWETQNGRILTHVFDTHYESPLGYDWESLEHPSVPITKSNIRNRTDELITVVLERSEFYRSNHLLLPFGGDFRFQDAHTQFVNMEKIVDFVRQNPSTYPNITFRYSTPREYRQALQKYLESNKDADGLPTMRGSNFLPDMTGYYTQLPMLKQMLRSCESLLRTCETHLVRYFQYNSISEFVELVAGQLEYARREVAMMQHHDAITATSYRSVNADYMQRLSLVFAMLSDILGKILLEDQDTGFNLNSLSVHSPRVIGGGPYLYETAIVRDTQSAKTIHMNRIVNPQMGGSGILLVVVNSLTSKVGPLVHFVSVRPDVSVELESTGESVLSQATALEQEVQSSNLGLFLISFRARVPESSFSSYMVRVCVTSSSTDQHPPEKVSQCATESRSISKSQLVLHGIGTESLHASFGDDLSLMSLQLSTNNETIGIDLAHDLVIYDGSMDNIYSMKTSLENSYPTPFQSPKRLVSAFVGPIFAEATVEFDTWFCVRFRIFSVSLFASKAQDLFEVSVLSGPIPPISNVASRFTANLTSTSWYYDENGFHPTLAEYNHSRPVGDNLKPFVSRSWLTEKRLNGLTIMFFTVDPRACVSHQDGQMDVMWHRRNNQTSAWWDKGGIDWWKEGQDVSVVRSSVWVSLFLNTDGKRRINLQTRRVSRSLENDAVLLAVQSPTPHPMKSSCLSSLPPEIHLVTLKLTSQQEGIGSRKDWLDIQLENMDDEATQKVNLGFFFSDFKDVILDAAELRSLSFLNLVENSESCSLEISNGGKSFKLRVAPRMICSLRLPVVPASRSETHSSSTWRPFLRLSNATVQ